MDLGSKTFFHLLAGNIFSTDGLLCLFELSLQRADAYFETLDELLGMLGDPDVAGGWQENGTVRLYWPANRWNDETRARLEAMLDQRVAINSIPSEDWNALWTASVQPFRVGRRLVVRPSWHAAELKPGDLELIIDPACSVAFEMEPGDPDLMRRPPRRVGSALFQPRLVLLSALQGASLLVPALLAFRAGLAHTGAEGSGRALAFAALVSSRRTVDKEMSLLVRRLAGLGLLEAETAAAIQRQDVKDRLRAETDAALAKGVFGSPFFLLDGEGFWGADRLDQLEWRLQGSPRAAAGVTT